MAKAHLDLGVSNNIREGVWYLIHWIVQRSILVIIWGTEIGGRLEEELWVKFVVSVFWDCAEREMQYGIHNCLYICWFKWRRNLIEREVAIR